MYDAITLLLCVFIFLQVDHLFLCEWIPWKQRHLQEMVKNKNDECCIFADASKVFTEERHCVRHEECCETHLSLGLFLSLFIYLASSSLFHFFNF